MPVDRRTFLAGLGLSLAGPLAARAAAEPEPLFMSSARHGDTHQAIVFDPLGRTLAAIDLPARGHGFALHPDGRMAVVFARRPETFAIAFHPRDGRILAALTAPEGRHFYGHGAFSADGRRLFTTENDYDGERGVIGIWDVSPDFARLGEWDAHGIGPHDIVPLDGGRLLAVANGGIATHPETGRRKLNIPDMEPSLVLLDAETGTRQAGCTLPHDLHKLSIRHLAVNRSGVVAAAMQYEGPGTDTPPLILTWQGGAPALVDAPGDLARAMHNYCGAIAMDTSGTVMAASCPRGNLVTFWEVASRRLMRTLEIEDGCGLAPTRRRAEFLVTSGFGTRLLYDAATGTTRPLAAPPATAWDNHAAML